MANRQSQFYNRIPWYPLLAIATMAFVVVATATAPWLLLLPILAWVYDTVRLYRRRKSQLKNLGYFSGSQYHDYWIYEERRGRSVVALLLPLERTDPNLRELFIPDEDMWRKTVPCWAADRRVEIALRIAESWKPAHFHFVEPTR
jgi:hypothetical protein